MDKVKFPSAPKAEILAALQRDANMQDVTYPTITFDLKKLRCDLKLGLLDYDKNQNHNYFGQYCNHGYLKYERFI